MVATEFDREIDDMHALADMNAGGATLAADAPLISICVCTFKRATGLTKVLNSLAVMTRPLDCRLEVIVVDNDAAASAQAVVAARAADFPLPLRYFCESRSGVGFARNRCLSEAAGEWIAFIDDDEWAEPQWLDELWRQVHAGPFDGVFGPVLANFEVEPPEWLVGSGVYERPRHPSGSRLPWPDCASGNALFRKRLVDQVGRFSPKFASSGAEDSEFFWRCLDAGAVFVWCDTAVAQENIPPARMTRQWVLRRAYLAGHNYARLNAFKHGRGVYVSLGLRGLVAMALFGLRALAARVTGDPRSLAYESKVVGGWGKLLAAVTPAETEYGPGK